MISVLYVEKKSIYKTLGVDCWDAERDALLYAGSSAVVAHPPCRTWSQFRAFTKAPIEERQLALHAVRIIKQNGGVLEHPRSSALWKEPGVVDGCILLSVDQSWWGHPCRKRTGLLVSGIAMADIPPMPITFEAPTHVVASSKSSRRREIPKSKRSHTPLRFALWLIALAELIEKNKKTYTQWQSPPSSINKPILSTAKKMADQPPPPLQLNLFP